ncbi:MAG: hypothetical protein C0448_15855 [Sphingobacteriaceae bacterium]|nr:hypothetical protein [Sphingobacteriaceae bacterium]
MKKIVLLVLLISFNLINAQVELKWAVNFPVHYANQSGVDRSVVADKFGNVYSTGSYLDSIDLDPGTATHTFTLSNMAAATYISKLDINGNFIWAKKIEGPVNVVSRNMEIDSLGNLIIIGTFDNNILNNPIDFDPGPGVYNLAASGNEDGFVLKLDSDGNFIWVKNIGGLSANVYVTGLDLDKYGNIYFGGNFTGTVDFDLGSSTHFITSIGTISSYADAFVLKLDKNGNYIWSGVLGGSLTSSILDISVDNSCNVNLLGQHSGTVDCDPGTSVFNVNNFSGSSINFLTRLDSLGNFVWVKSFPNSSGSIRYRGTACDTYGNIYMAGNISGTYDIDPNIGVYNVSGNPLSGIILKLDSFGNFIYGHQFIGEPASLAIDYSFVYVKFYNNILMLPGIRKLDLNGNFIWQEMSGDVIILNDTDGSFYVDQSQNIYIINEFTGTADFDPNPGIYNLSAPNDGIFIQKLGPCTSLPPSSPADITPLANKSICANATTTLTVASNNLFINWYSSPTSTVVLSTDTFYVPSVLPVGTYTYYAESKDCLYSTARTPITFTVNAPPVISAPNGTVCPNQAFTITPTGAVTYSYSSLNPVVYPPSTNTYTVTGFSSAGCSAATTLTVYTLPLPNVTSNGSGAICTGNSFTINASGAVTYTYASATSTVTSTSNTIVVSPTTTTQYTVFGASSAGCVKYTDFNVFVDQYPSLVTSQSQSVICIGASDTLRASGATNHIWNGSTNTTSIVVSPTVTTNYTVVGLTGMGLCLTTHTLTVVVNPNCQDVWPGDANSDGIANNLDVLELGLHYTQTGTPRASTSNTWQSYFANNWTGTITNGKNLNHSDCNGDGTINDNDTLAIFNNYGLTHTFKQEEINSVNPQLRIVPDQAYVTKGNWGTASIFLGDATANINNINGVAFTIGFNNTLIEPSNIWLEYLPSFIDASQNLHFRKLDFANGKIFTATTHTLNNNVSGNGLIAKLHYQIKSNLTTDDVLSIGLSLANKSNATGVITPLTTGTGTLMIIGASVGLQELNGNVISVSPNPTNGSLTITSKIELQKIEVMSVDGKILLSEIPTNISHTLHLDNFANGIYFVNLYQNNRVVMREKVILNK